MGYWGHGTPNIVRVELHPDPPEIAELAPVLRHAAEWIARMDEQTIFHSVVIGFDDEFAQWWVEVNCEPTIGLAEWSALAGLSGMQRETGE